MKAYELLDTPDKWMKGRLAENTEGREVPFNDPSAVRFCLLGALLKCYDGFDGTNYMNAYQHLQNTIGRVVYTNVVAANNSGSTTFEDIQRWLRKADV